jgi:hypothetical protein
MQGKDNTKKITVHTKSEIARTGQKIVRTVERKVYTV